MNLQEWRRDAALECLRQFENQMGIGNYGLRLPPTGFDPKSTAPTRERGSVAIIFPATDADIPSAMCRLAGLVHKEVDWQLFRFQRDYVFSISGMRPAEHVADPELGVSLLLTALDDGTRLEAAVFLEYLHFVPPPALRAPVIEQIEEAA
jgi:hypothetical protein